MKQSKAKPERLVWLLGSENDFLMLGNLHGESVVLCCQGKLSFLGTLLSYL